MTASPGTSATDADVARLAYAIWEAEGRPEGRDHDHWMRAKQLIEEGRAEAEFPDVQPGFEDVPPGIVPKMKEDVGPELREGPGGRFAKQIAELPEERLHTAETEAPGPRNPAPIPPTNPEGFVSIRSVDDASGRALSDDPVPPPSGDGQREVRRRRGKPVGTSG
jgi:Protein of unknown function (DUF2934)